MKNVLNLSKIAKYFVIIVLLMGLSIGSSKAQFHKDNGEFFEWGGTYKYTTSNNGNYTLDVWGYEGEFEAILTYSDGSSDYKLNCMVDFLEIDYEIMWKSMYIKYTSVADGTFPDKEYIEQIRTALGGAPPTIFVLSMIKNEIYTEVVNIEIEGVESERPTKNIFKIQEYESNE